MGMVRAVSRLYVLYPDIFITTEEKARKNSQTALSKSASWTRFNLSPWLPFAVAVTSVDPDLPALGCPEQRSVSQGICRSA
jgi:hypothetical protein